MSRDVGGLTEQNDFGGLVETTPFVDGGGAASFAEDATSLLHGEIAFECLLSVKGRELALVGSQNIV